MLNYKRLLPRLVLIGGTAAALVFTSRMVERLCSKQERRQTAALSDWEDEGGRLAPADVATP
jgi:hypothetical protein